MLPWNERSIEIANLINPAFTSLLLREATWGFQQKQASMSIEWTYLVLPMILHKPIRSVLPQRTNRRLYAWIQEHPEIQLRFTDKIKAMVQHTNEALMFGLQQHLLALDQLGGLVLGKLDIPTKYPFQAKSEASECIEKARFLGRWLSIYEPPTTVYVMLGVSI